MGNNKQKEQKEQIERFKKLLERYVAYMEYLANTDKTQEPQVKGNEELWATIINNLPQVKVSDKKEKKTIFPRGGEGHLGKDIQKVLSDVDVFVYNKTTVRIYMSVRADNGYTKNNGNFLHGENSYLNISPIWKSNSNNNKITKLKLGFNDNNNPEKDYLLNKQWDNKEYSVGELFESEKLDKLNEMYLYFFNSYTTLIPYLKSKQLDEATALLKTNKNLVLTGAPGTGKTFMAKNIAAKLIFGDSNLHDFAKYDEWESSDTDAFKAQVGFVQFHPSYDYTDFVEGLRPFDKDNNGTPGFRRQDGVFKKFCKEALKGNEKNYVFIIDEINRGELNKIFGELFFSIDPGYRGEKGKANTQYQNLVDYERNEEGEYIKKASNSETTKNKTEAEVDVFKEGFFIPENVYIIGTMNDIDRSVDSMDFAIRRRFAWKEVLAKDTIMMLDSLTSVPNDAKQKYDIIDHMARLNDVIEKTFDSTSYQIGASYFLKIKEYSAKDNKKVTADSYNKLWDYHLAGVLQEYVRGRSDAKDLMKKFRAAYDGKDVSDHTEE